MFYQSFNNYYKYQTFKFFEVQLHCVVQLVVKILAAKYHNCRIGGAPDDVGKHSKEHSNN